MASASCSAKVGGPDDLVPLQQNPTATSDAIEAKRLRLRLFVKAGQREITVAVLGEAPALFAASRLQPFIRDFANPYAAEGAAHVQSVTIQGPYNGKPSAAAPSPSVFSCRPATAAEELPCARRIASRLATRAYRRPLATGELDGSAHLLQAGARARRLRHRYRLRPEAYPREPVLRVPSGARAGRLAPGDALPRGRRRAGVEALVLPLEHDPRRAADGPGGQGDAGAARRPVRSRCGGCWPIRAPTPW